MLLIEKKVIEEREDSLPYVLKSDLLLNSKEVEVVDVFDEQLHLKWLNSNENNIINYLSINGYKLIKIKE